MSHDKTNRIRIVTLSIKNFRFRINCKWAVRMACEWERKRELILFSDCLDCLLERAFRAYFATRDCSALVHSKIVCFGHIMSRFVQSRRLKFWDPSSSTTFFCAVPGKLVFVLANIKRKKRTWPILAILTLRFVNKLKAKIVRAG